MKITGLQPIAFSALHFSPEDLDPGLTRKLQHTIDIVPQKNIFLHVDLKQRGLGGDNSWGCIHTINIVCLIKNMFIAI